MFIPAAICSPAIAPAICSPAVLATMPHKAVSVFNYASRRDGLLGSIWAQSMPGGCDYEQYWSGVLYGAYWQMPLNYHNKVETMSFPKIGFAKDRPVGDQMRPPYSPKLMSRKVFVLSKENTNCKKQQEIKHCLTHTHLFFIQTYSPRLMYLLFVSLRVQSFL